MTDCCSRRAFGAPGIPAPPAPFSPVPQIAVLHRSRESLPSHARPGPCLRAPDPEQPRSIQLVAQAEPGLLAPDSLPALARRRLFHDLLDWIVACRPAVFAPAPEHLSSLLLLAVFPALFGWPAPGPNPIPAAQRRIQSKSSFVVSRRAAYQISRRLRPTSALPGTKKGLPPPDSD